MRRRNLGVLAGVVVLVPLAVVASRKGTAPAPTPNVVVAAKAAPREPRADKLVQNLAAYLPAQCYAETRRAAPGSGGRAHNPCFTCHQDSRAPNYADDADTQTTLTFPRYATDNRWSHIFESPAPALMADDALLAWVREDNYAPGVSEGLADRLRHPAPAWDVDGDGVWSGFVPDAAFRFDDRGFDRDASGAATGWRAFAYAPLPGMFWPTNGGSAGDALIRLPVAYRNDAAGRPSETIYATNLALLEAYVRRVDVPIPPADEAALGVDLDGDGRLGTASRIAFVWPPKPGTELHYVGQAATLDRRTEGWPVAGLFPRGTEFLHSLRYLDVVDGKTRMGARMKELRTMRKTRWLTYSDLELLAEGEAREKRKSPDRLRWILGDAEHGVLTATGWSMQGFIEDAGGALRPQTFEETAACIGCHSGIGAPTDGVFSLPRKLGAGTFADGWYHWKDKGLAGIAEPKRADGEGEYAHYLEAVGGGDDFRANDEIQRTFFRPDGRLDEARRRAFAKDVSVLLVPSPSRAMALDRAYLGLVKEQRFEAGRDVLVGAAPRVRRHADQDEATGIEAPLSPPWRAPEKPARTAPRG